MKAVAELIWTNSYGSTTVDQICAKACVRKGSFYHFFDAKSDLAQPAIEGEWNRIRSELDRIFSPTVPPLERLRGFCRHAHEMLFTEGHPGTFIHPADEPASRPESSHGVLQDS